MLYLLLITIFTKDGITSKHIEYPTMNDCYVAREALEETLDKLGQKTKLTYTIECVDNK